MSLLDRRTVTFDQHVGLLILTYSVLILESSDEAASRIWIKSHEPQAWFDLCPSFYFRVARRILFASFTFGTGEGYDARAFFQRAPRGPLRLASCVRYLYLDVPVDYR